MTERSVEALPTDAESYDNALLVAAGALALRALEHVYESLLSPWTHGLSETEESLVLMQFILNDESFYG